MALQAWSHFPNSPPPQYRVLLHLQEGDFRNTGLSPGGLQGPVAGFVQVIWSSALSVRGELLTSEQQKQFYV